MDRLLNASSIRSGDLVFDLGAGRGLIAERLVRQGCNVVAVELDPALAAGLGAQFAHEPLVRVCHADILSVRLPDRPCAYSAIALG